MTETQLKIFIRVIRRRMATGERLEDILATYPRLTNKEKEAIREAVEN